MIEIVGNTNILMNYFLMYNLVVNPPSAYDYSDSFNTMQPEIIDTDDYADISYEAYELAIMDDISIPQNPTDFYSNNFSSWVTDYLNRDFF